MIGIGAQDAWLNVYIENVPPLNRFEQLGSLEPLQQGDIYQIARQTGNHWRKIFNVYAKIVFELQHNQCSTWQQLRDEQLLQVNSNQCLWFHQPDCSKLDNNNLHLLMGRTYASKLLATKPALKSEFIWLDEFFAVNPSKKIIICPYFDYRQLSNIKILRLVSIMKSIL